MMDTPKAPEFMESRYIRQSDPKTDTLVFPLHPAWWSRPYEYEWARRFARPDDVVLDAACGISHPFKFWLAEHCREVHACDWDERILSEEAIRLDIVSDFGEQAAMICRNPLSSDCSAQRLIWPSFRMSRVSLIGCSVSLYWSIWIQARCCGRFVNSLGC